MGKKLNNVHRAMPPGTVILQGKTFLLFKVMGTGARRVAKNRPKLLITICYCSLYGDCWVSRSNRSRDKRVPHCPKGKASGFYAKAPKPITTDSA
jgi:hypothetical protein